jgi:NAD(P)-dependent dehydrogenase (short-subunit alcohol dehydrogenase family)
MRLDGRIAIVTGAASGFGRATAVRLAEEGASVLVADVDGRGGEESVALVEKAGGQAELVVGDIATEAGARQAVEQAVARFGTVDVLVNNAGNIYAARHFLEGDEAWWDQVLGVNLKGAFLCSKRAADVMVRKRAGVIINMSSGGATRAHRGNVAYDASKGGIEAMTRAMALDLAPYGVRVNAIVPGLIRTYDISDEVAVERGAVVPMARLGTPEDIAGPTVFLATDAARYMTGACVAVDGGLLVQQRSTPVDTFPVSRFPVVE